MRINFSLLSLRGLELPYSFSVSSKLFGKTSPGISYYLHDAYISIRVDPTTQGREKSQHQLKGQSYSKIILKHG